MPFRPKPQHAVTPQHQGRFPGFDVLDQVPYWDDVTAGVVLARLALPNMLSFFTPHEVGVAAPMLDLLLGARRRAPGPGAAVDRHPLVDRRDRRLALRRPARGRPGLARHAGAPGRRRPRSARRRVRRTRPQTRQARLLQDVQDLAAGGHSWHGLDAAHVWSLWTRYACAAFYSHPWAWNEIGFSGPAYPRGYLNPGINARENWEVADHHDVDPIPFVERVERARRADDDLSAGARDE